MSQNLNYEVIVLYNGYSEKLKGGSHANCTSTLLKGPKNNIIIDTMTAWDGEKLIDALHKNDLTCDDIDYVICTHGHSDHIGCNYLFTKATHLVGKCISHKQNYYDHNFNDPYKIDEAIQIIATPGHTLQDITVLVKNTNGITAVVGDLFENENDLTDDNIWKSAGSDSEQLQYENRNKILGIADWIIPGHGKMFKVNK